LTCVLLQRPFTFESKLSDLKHDFIEDGFNIEQFHAHKDKRRIKQCVFDVIRENISIISIYSVIIDKRKTIPSLQQPIKFYPKMLGYLIKFMTEYVVKKSASRFIIITDKIPHKGKIKAIEKAIIPHLARIVPEETRFTLLHHSSKSNYCLQVVDYCNWAIMRKWAREDTCYYDLIKTGIQSEFDIFNRGEFYYY
jgi:hypothetical protein